MKLKRRESNAIEDNLRSELNEAKEELKDLKYCKRKLESFVQEHEETLQKKAIDTS